MQRASSVDHYLELHPQWAGAITKLRKILVATELEEAIKWGAPCYTLDGKNVIGIGAFKHHLALWFHQGAHLKDAEGLLLNAQEGVTRALRQWRFDNEREIKVTKVRAYVKEAIANQKAGKESKPRKKGAVVVPPELQAALAKKPKVKAAFEALTPGRQREYAEHIATAKRAETKTARIEKILPMIAAGGGLHDRYRGC